jgi:radical SAM superfamily enzyme YgiQ (UPF0313 family)
LAQRTWLVVEYGLQTIHDRTLNLLNRGHGYDAFLDACRRSSVRGLNVGVHVILGLPGETRDDMLATARELVEKTKDLAHKIAEAKAAGNKRQRYRQILHEYCQGLFRYHSRWLDCRWNGA